MSRAELEHFVNRGFGWVCRRCEETAATAEPRKSRLFSEGESEAKEPALSTGGLARWTDAKRNELECPRCGARERTSDR